MPPPLDMCRLIMENLPPESQPQRSPSWDRAASPVVEEAPASPIVHCSQYRMEECKLQNKPLPGHDKVDCWLRDIQAAYKWGGIVLPNATRSTAPGSIRLGLGLRARPSALGQPAIAAGYAHQEYGALYVHKDY